MPRILIVIVSFVCLFSSAAGCSPQPTVLLRAFPNPFPTHRGYSLAPVSFDGMVVGDVPFSTWIAQRTPEQQQSFRADLEALSSRFAAEVHEQCSFIRGEPNDPGMFVIRPTLIRTGLVSFTESTQDTRLTVRIVSEQGTPLEVFVLHDFGGGYALGDRLRHAGTTFGRQFCAYMRRRIRG